MKQRAIDFIVYAWIIMPRRLRLWAFMNDGIFSTNENDRSIKMRRRQPDNRIHKHELGSFTPTTGGNRFVVNLRPGVPRNACIEEFRDGALRCWASHTWLDDPAAEYVRTNATFNPDKNSFVWNEGVKVRETRRG